LYFRAITLWLKDIGSTANPGYTADELHYQLTTVKTSLLLVHPAVLETALVAAKKAGLSADRVVLFDNSIPALHTAFQNLIAEGLTKNTSFVERRLAPGEAKSKIAFLCFSSGTTGRPKVSERTLVIMNLSIYLIYRQLRFPTIRS